MSTKWDKAAKWVKDLRDRYSKQAEEYEAKGALIPMDALYPYIQALDLALAALRGPTREQVEKVWRGEWLNFYGDYSTAECRKCGELFYVSDTDENLKMLFDAFKKNYRFCPACGAPMTDEAVQMVMERLEALYERNDD